MALIVKLSKKARDNQRAKRQRKARRAQIYSGDCEFCAKGCNGCAPIKLPPFKIITRPWLIIPRIPIKYVNMIRATGETRFANIAAALHIEKKAAAAAKDPFRQLEKPFAVPFRLPVNPFMRTAGDITRCIGYVKANQRVRTAFEKIARRFIHSRLKTGNTEDLLTNEIPRHPVTLISWAQRSIHTFEASTLRRDMIERLLLSNYNFSNAQMPRNPYTNLPLTTGQSISCIEQIRRTGKSHWAIEAFASAEYDIAAFKENFKEAILLEILRRQYLSPTNEETTTLIYEFMEDQHEDYGCSFYGDVYKWALKNCPNATRITSWRRVWYLYNKLLITQPDHKAANSLLRCTKVLCTHPRELIEAKVAASIKKHSSVEDGEISLGGYYIVVGGLAWNEPL